MKNHIRHLVQHALNQLTEQGVLPKELTPNIQVENTRDKAHGDFACNIAMMLAKPAQMKPRDLAEKIIQALPQDPQISQVQIAGPGFLNFFQNSQALAERLDAALADEHLGIAKKSPAETVVIDLSSPNLAKEMHVGHLRSTIIGDAVARVLEFLGDHVIRQNHVGDWGTQFGMLLAYMQEQGADSQAELADLEEFYRAAKQRFDESPEFANRARQLVVALQAGDEDCLRLWQRFNEVSLNHCQAVYDRLDVKLSMDDVKGESFYNPDLATIVQELKNQGLLTEDAGAQCVFMDEFKNADNDPLPIIVQKADGGYLYSTTDLAAMRYRNNQLQADRVLYFVDQRQALHFQMVFSLARLAGFVRPAMQLEHMGFGTMNGADGRPFKTRDGGTVKLIDLLDEAEQRAYQLVKQKNPELNEDELQQVAHSVGIGAVKYADLSKHRSSDYSFNFEQMLSFEGNTAPYLLYAYTRVASVFRKAGLTMDAALPGSMQLATEQELSLASSLARFAEVLQQVADKGTPHTLCTYLYDLAGQFSSFYENCPILTAEQESTQHSRLRLAALTGRTLKQGLELLGLNTLERM
ncbi:arginyl-tRNA synthetase [Thiopseudomonas alkaliphila]|uniref:arginine--tRNA ligase n=1 Tax=Thiopseudomonas alkaliphila TaxID=1697053 RepID=UPI00069F551B|nr:arginine--tRNA ligase [Thiopseudomonas alkaliphila]AKX46713.1 arginyl-tRNA synthetase [Thiopseudomonas alkaliphila]AKX49817.1 arginyl-tRNA synthetase [Thiopseudomonas alkaliphila]